MIEELPEPVPHRPFEHGAAHLALGLSALPPGQWIEFDNQVPGQLALRAGLLAERRQEVVAARPGTEAICRELLDLLAAHLPLHHAGWFERQAGTLHSRLTGARWTVEGPVPEPLAVVGHLVAEDFCLLRPSGGEAILEAAVLCFPSRWRLSEKIGRPLLSVHAPVPFYQESLATPVDRFLAALKPGRIARRYNWSLLDDPALFQPQAAASDAQHSAITSDDAAERIFLRVERQSFRRLQHSAAIAFGIRTHVTPLGTVLAERGASGRLAAALRQLPEATQRYKNLLAFRGALLAALDAADR